MRVCATQVQVCFQFSNFVDLFCVKNKANQLSVLLSDDPDTVRAARRDSTCSFYQPPPPTDIERMRNNMIKEQKVFALIREILGRKTTLVLNNKVCDELQFWDADVRYLFVMQPTWVLCGCCFWWRTVRGTPMRIFWPNTSDRASAKRSQTVWVFRMCSTGQTQLCWATCLGSTQVSMLWSYKQLHTTALPEFLLKLLKIFVYSWQNGNHIFIIFICSFGK